MNVSLHFFSANAVRIFFLVSYFESCLPVITRHAAAKISLPLHPVQVELGRSKNRPPVRVNGDLRGDPPVTSRTELPLENQGNAIAPASSVPVDQTALPIGSKGVGVLPSKKRFRADEVQNVQNIML
jgi:hypothetical protein